MRINHKFLAAGIAALTLGATPIAMGAGGATATATPVRVKEFKTVEMLVKGMRPNERIRAHEVAPNGQTRNLYPRAGAGGSLIVRVKAQIKGKHVWTFTGRRSHRKASTYYRVR
jgi:hypothetical protein